jgi:hypothetical protein
VSLRKSSTLGGSTARRDGIRRWATSHRCNSQMNAVASTRRKLGRMKIPRWNTQKLVMLTPDFIESLENPVTRMYDCPLSVTPPTSERIITVIHAETIRCGL